MARNLYMGFWAMTIGLRCKLPNLKRIGDIKRGLMKLTAAPYSYPTTSTQPKTGRPPTHKTHSTRL